MKEEYTYKKRTHKKRTQLIGLLFILVLFGIIINYSNISTLKKWYWEYEPLHVALEIFGALSAILMALVLFQRKREEKRGRFVFIVLGLLSMGILDIFHAISPSGDRFVFLHSIAGLAGGLFSSLVWLPPSVSDRNILKKNGIFRLIITLSLLLATCIFIFPGIVPKMVYGGEFTTTAILINLLASSLFLSTGLYFLRDFYRSGNFEFYLFACLYVILSLTSLSFFPSVLWNGEWWLWHLLRQGAYLISSGFIVYWYLTIVAEQKRVKEALQKRTYELGERIKELNCLYAISKIMDKQDISLEEILQVAVRIIPPAWQYPEITCAQVILEDRVFRTDNFKETIWKQSSDIIVYGNQIGTLEVFYQEEKPEEDDGPFLKEERHLINTIARRLGEFTEKKRAEEKIKNLAKFPSENPNPVLRVAKDGRVLYTNAASLALLAEWNSGVGKMIPGDCYRMIMRSVNSNQNIIGEFTVKDSVYSFVITPVADTDYVNLYGRDITARKRAEEELKKYRLHLEELVKERTAELLSTNKQLQQEIIARRKVEEELQKAQKLESLSVLAGGIAHDFNNLLAAIIGNLSLVEQYAKSGASIFKALGDAKKACYQTKELTQQLLTFSKGGAPIKKIASIPELVREVVNFSLRGSKVRCEFDLPDNLWPVEIDAGQISQVINNLIINASQAMPGGGIIRLCAENIIMRTNDNDMVLLKEGKYIKISVKDQGIGIPKEHLSKIFDPYFTTKETGSGLGLAISYSIIKKHGGYITAESESGAGTTFYIYLPASEKDLFRVEHIVEEENLASGRGKILLMDDQESLREMVGEMLVYLGYEVVLAREGDEAIELYRKAKESGRDFDAVILDLTVPGGTGGKEAVQKLREIDPGVKAVISSGYSYDPIISEYEKYGFSGVVAKPYEVGELSKVLYKVIGGTQGVSHI